MPFESPAPRRNTPGFVVGWIWTVLMAFLALGCFSTGRPATGALALLSALVALPPASDLVARRWPIAHSEWIRLAIVVALLFPMGATVNDIEPEPAKPGDSAATAALAAPDNSQVANAATPSATSLPTDLAQLAHVVAKAKSDYTSADNDLKKSVIRTERDESAATAVPGGNFANWPGTLEELSTNDNGDAYITVRLDDCDCSVKTWDNPYRDRQDNSLIKTGTSLFNKLLNMHKGDHVVVSGRMLEEGSMTEEGSIDDPEWIAQFSDVSPG